MAGVRLTDTLCLQEAESHGYSAHFFLFIQFRTPAYGMAPPTVGTSALLKEPIVDNSSLFAQRLVL